MCMMNQFKQKTCEELPYEWMNEVETLRNCVWFEKLEAENV